MLASTKLADMEDVLSALSANRQHLTDNDLSFWLRSLMLRASDVRLNVEEMEAEEALRTRKIKPDFMSELMRGWRKQ